MNMLHTLSHFWSIRGLWSEVGVPSTVDRRSGPDAVLQAGAGGAAPCAAEPVGACVATLTSGPRVPRTVTDRYYIGWRNEQGTSLVCNFQKEKYYFYL